MLQMESLVQVADNTGARTAKMIGVIGKSGADQAHIGDIITCHIRESIPTASVKKGTVVKAVVVRTAAPIRRDDGSVLRFDTNAVDNHVEVYMAFLRKKLRSIDSNIEITAIRRMGYHLELKDE